MKIPTQWVSQDGASTVATTNAGVKRVTQDGTQRVLQDGTTARVLEDVVLTVKELTQWQEL